jgi:hypothetical protein
MRFCPFCAQENTDDARECGQCGKRLPAPRPAPHRTPLPPPSQRPKVEPRPAPRSRPLEALARGELDPVGSSSASAAPVEEALAVDTAPNVKLPPAAVDASAGDGDTAPAVKLPAPRAHDPRPAKHDDSLAPPTTPGPPRPTASAPTGTLLGLSPVVAPTPPPQPATPVRVPGPEDSQRRQTRPLQVNNGTLPKPEPAASSPTPPSRDGTPRRPSLFTQSVVDPSAAPPDSDEILTTPNPRIGPDSLTLERPVERPVRRTPPPAAIPPAAGPPSISTEPTPLPPPIVPAPPRPRRDSVPSPPTPTPPPVERAAAPSSAPSILDDAVAALAPPTSSSPGTSAAALPPTPAIPTLAVPPMPPAPSDPTVLSSVKYLWPLARAVWARKKAQKTIRELLHGDQRLLDQVLRELGRTARQENPDLPGLADEMRRVRAEEERRAKADADILEAQRKTDEERDRWAEDEATRKADLARREAELRALEDELKDKGAERRRHQDDRNRFDAQIRALEKKAAQADARAAKAETTPPEKGGGPNTAANCRMEAEAARKEATSLITPRDDARARAEALDGPISELTQKILDAKAALAEKRRELAEAQAEHKKVLAELEAERKRAEAEREGAEREMSQRFVAAGTLLNLDRVDHPAFAPLYARIDELKSGVAAREAAIVRLETERRTFDRAAVQKGLITLGVAGGSLVLVLIVLIVVFAR